MTRLALGAGLGCLLVFGALAATGLYILTRDAAVY